MSMSTTSRTTLQDAVRRETRGKQPPLSLPPAAWPVLIALFLLAFVLPSCSDLGSPDGMVEEGDLRVTATGEHLLVFNSGEQPVYTFIVETGLVPLIDWIPRCVDDQKIEARSARVFPYSAITGYKDSCELTVYWWQCPPETSFPGEMASLRIRTP